MNRYNTLCILLVFLCLNSNFTTAQCVVADTYSENNTEDYLQVDDDDGLTGYSSSQLEINGDLYFTADDGLNGIELWKIDGETGDIILVKDINQGSDSSYPKEFREIDGKLIFKVYSSGGSHLWISDGTTDGTYMLTDNLGQNLTSISGLTKFGNEIYFSAQIYQITGNELWKTDGTTEGTVLVKDIAPGTFYSSPRELTVLNDELFFGAWTQENGRELWKTDGSESGTVLVKDIALGEMNSSPNSIFSDGSQLWFSAIDSQFGSELWTSDGTESGTYLVKDINSGPNYSYPNPQIIYNTELFFTAANSFDGPELWKSDGTEEGTVLVKDILPGTGVSIFTDIVELNSMLYFGATDGSGPQLWKSDGTTEGTVLVKQINELGNQYCEFFDFIVVNDKLVFSASDGLNGMELWVSDGTEIGTYQAADINPGPPSSNPSIFYPVGDTIYFAADDGTHGFEMWTYNCLTGNVELIKDINTNRVGSFIRDLLCLDDELIYNTIDRLYNLEGVILDFDIVGSEILGFSIFGSFFEKLGSNIIFMPFSQEHGYELWITDGTSGGTSLLKDINLGGNVQIQSPKVIGQKMYFGAKSVDAGLEPWVTDGTSEGTIMLKDINVGTGPSSPIDFMDINGTVYFNTLDGVWKTDGTPIGTEKIIEKDNFYITKFGSSLIFQKASAEFGAELWKSDGTVDGTMMIKDINQGEASSSPSEFTVFGNEIYFTAKTEDKGIELWKSDGTESGTQLVKDIHPGSGSTSISHLVSTDTHLYFVANTSSNGRELWKTDGTDLGTLMVKDINPGSGGSNLSNLGAVGSALYFNAYNGESFDIWTTDGTASGTLRLTTPDDFDGAARYIGHMILCDDEVYFTIIGKIGELYSLTCDSIECTSVATNTWQGPQVDNWNKTPVYWETGRLPTTCDDVVIPSGYSITLQSGNSAECHTLQVDLGAQLDIENLTNFRVNNK